MEATMGTIDGVALITGAGSGMGRASAVAFAQAGAKLILVDVVQKALDETVALIGKVKQPIKLVVLDITKDEEVVALIRGIPQMEGFGRLDYALNCAGVLGRVRAPFVDSDQKDVDFVYSVNLRAQGLMMQEEIKLMLQQEPLPSSGKGKIPGSRGSIVNWCSWVSFHSSKTNYAYAASKYGMAALTKSAALSHAAQGIRCNAVAPGAMDTPLLLGASQEFRDKMLAAVPQARFGEPEEVADVALWLCSNRATYVNGAIINVDGAWHAA
ncbi:NAD(P)-binding protein [Cystobasidium minutum MCA 4210]|uniref:NAD(P)-binding protein n=1 Tax=Cystobasidium minutum MCA 4210 TaxID=1397322 RepID=UPI0034CF2999|eukprot:jgi/Rhomi1/175391/fgenesh1_kg.10_\